MLLIRNVHTNQPLFSRCRGIQRKQSLTITGLLFFMGLYSTAFSQDVVHRNDTIEVWENGKQLALPWAAGINGGQFSEIDLNMDGLMDFIIFETNFRYDPLTGDRISPFLKQPKDGGGYRYVYAPEFRDNFPKLENFLTLRDFNGDGKMDIFTTTVRGYIDVYRNDGDANELRFTHFIQSLEATANGLPPSFPYIPVISHDLNDMPSYEDMDGDGDIDLLLQHPMYEEYLRYYKNISPSRDTIILELKSTCWGNAKVHFDSLVLNRFHPLGNVSNPENVRPNGKEPVYSGHSGGTKGAKDFSTSLLAVDLDGNGVKDLITGSRTSLRMMMNGGSTTSSNFISFANSYPPSFPLQDFHRYVVPSYLDLDHDDVKDLVATGMYDSFKDVENVYFYKNTGSNNVPNFTFQTKSFLQEEMIEVGKGAYPVFVDYDGDSLMDMVIGNEGYFIKFANPYDDVDSKLTLYKNTGSLRTPKFELVNRDFGGISTLLLDTETNEPADALHPAFGDLDNDGDVDMILGDFKGKLHYFENTAGTGNPMNFAAPIIDYQSIDVGDMAAPQLVDLNRDGLLDLVVGELEGTINYFQNTGTLTAPLFTLMDATLGSVLVNEDWDYYGNSRPFIYEDYSTKKYFLLCGSRSGFVHFYDSLEVNGLLSDTFRLRDSSFQNIWHGALSSISGADINADSSIDFLVGNYAGGVTLYTGDPNVIYIPGITEINGPPEVNLYPNPAEDHLYIGMDGHGATRKYTATIYTVVGEKVKNAPIDPGGMIDVQQLPPGLYVIRLENQADRIYINKKFVKE